MDDKQKKAIKKCFSAVRALEEERKSINDDIREEFKKAAEETGWDTKDLKNAFSLYKKEVSFDDIKEFYEIFQEIDNQYEE